MKKNFVFVFFILFLMVFVYPINEFNIRDVNLYETKMESAIKHGNVRYLSLKEAVEMGIKNNLDIKIEEYQPLLKVKELENYLGSYDPTLSIEVNKNRAERPITDLVNRAILHLDTVKNVRYNFNTTLSGNIKTGGNYSFSLINSRNSANTNAFNPTYNGQFKIDFNQPLWKNFRIDSIRKNIYITRIDKKISKLDLEQKISEIIYNIESAYWDLYNAIERQKVEITSREVVFKQLKDNIKRVEAGVKPPMIIDQTKSELSAADQQVISAENQVISAENTLKNLILSREKDTMWNLFIIPSDSPQIPDEEFPSFIKLYENAVKNRPEVKSLNLNLEKSDVEIKFAKNQTKPSLDFIFSVASNGVAGPNIKTPIYDENHNIIGFEDNEFTGRIGTAYREVFNFDYIDYLVGVKFTFTFGNRSAKASLAISKINRDSLRMQLRKLLQSIRVEIENNLELINVNKKSLKAAISAVKYRKIELKNQKKRFSVGLATNFDVLQAERDLKKALSDKISAEVSLRKAYDSLYKAIFENVKKYNIKF